MSKYSDKDNPHTKLIICSGVEGGAYIYSDKAKGYKEGFLAAEKFYEFTEGEKELFKLIFESAEKHMKVMGYPGFHTQQNYCNIKKKLLD